MISAIIDFFAGAAFLILISVIVVVALELTVLFFGWLLGHRNPHQPEREDWEPTQEGTSKTPQEIGEPK